MYCKAKLVDQRTGRAAKSDRAPLAPPADFSPLFHTVEDGVTWFYGTADVLPSDALPIADAAWPTVIEQAFSDARSLRIKEIYAQAIKLRDAALAEWYHPNELTIGLEKYRAALSVLAGTGTDEALSAEADLRGITVEELAQAIVNHWSRSRELDVQLTGIRGRKVDALNAIVFSGVESFAALLTVSVTDGWN